VVGWFGGLFVDLVLFFVLDEFVLFWCYLVFGV